MEKIKKIILNKEEQQTLKNYYKMVEEFQEFANLVDMEESMEWLTEFVLDWGSFDYNPKRKYAGVEIEIEGFERR